MKLKILTVPIASKKKLNLLCEGLMSRVLPPLCRLCGKPISKRTKTIMFGCEEQEIRDSEWLATRSEKPRNRMEVQRLVNQPPVSVRYVREYEGDRYVNQASVWDGVSYNDQYFCSSDHAQDFAYAVVQSPNNRLTTQAYRDAREAQSKKSKEN